MVVASPRAPPLTLVWHRRDLRLADNSLYSELDKTDRPSVSFYCFDPEEWKRRPSCTNPAWAVTHVGPHATVRLLEALQELRSSLRSRGGELIVRHGNPASILPQLALELQAAEVRFQEEPGVEEEAIAARVVSALRAARCRVETNFGRTLYHPDDLPQPEEWFALANPRQKQQPRASKRRAAHRGREALPPAHSKRLSERLASMPRVMGDWRRAARAKASPRTLLPAPSRLFLPEGVCLEAGEFPSFEELMRPAIPSDTGTLGSAPLFGMDDDVIQAVLARAAHYDAARDRGTGATCAAGERAAQDRLASFISSGCAGRADRSLADVGEENSARLSVALALGSLSPRQVYHAAKATEASSVDGGTKAEDGDSNGAGTESVAWLASHMEMRDFFIYTAVASGARLFARDGAPVATRRAAKLHWRDPASSPEAWKRWATGKTGLPLVDAAMRELMSTGYCSNRVRQNVASVLTKDLGLDWRAGAEWFQWLLVDHDVAVNWANWGYFAGVGSDPKSRHFRTVSQAARYDPTGSYVRKWLPELLGVTDPEALLRPFALVPHLWPVPLVDAATQVTWQDAAQLEEHGYLLSPALNGASSTIVSTIDGDDGEGQPTLE